MLINISTVCVAILGSQPFQIVVIVSLSMFRTLVNFYDTLVSEVPKSVLPKDFESNMLDKRGLDPNF